MERPRIAITMGDVAGIGPEVIVRALSDLRTRDVCHPVVVGDPQRLERAAALCKLPLRVRAIDSILDPAADDSVELLCWNPSPVDTTGVSPGRNDPRAGQAAFDWLVAAAQAALNREVDAITTAPLSKRALHLAGHHFPGHTEILAKTCNVEHFAMMLYVPKGNATRTSHGLGVAHVTLHTSLASVPALITPERVSQTIELLDRFLQRVGCRRPRIGVCALNPHAGEEGIFGEEESRTITPGIRAATDAGVNASGPVPADALLRRAVAGEFDGVVAMFHDQGHIALKLVAFDEAVNVTLGLPIVRTSPSQGTAFDIAWQGKARPDGMIGAIQTAALLAKSRE